VDSQSLPFGAERQTAAVAWLVVASRNQSAQAVHGAAGEPSRRIIKKAYLHVDLRPLFSCSSYQQRRPSLHSGGSPAEDVHKRAWRLVDSLGPRLRLYLGGGLLHTRCTSFKGTPQSRDLAPRSSSAAATAQDMPHRPHSRGRRSPELRRDLQRAGGIIREGAEQAVSAASEAHRGVLRRPASSFVQTAEGPC